MDQTFQGNGEVDREFITYRGIAWACCVPEMQSNSIPGGFHFHLEHVWDPMGLPAYLLPYESEAQVPERVVQHEQALRRLVGYSAAPVACDPRVSLRHRELPTLRDVFRMPFRHRKSLSTTTKTRRALAK